MALSLQPLAGGWRDNAKALVLSSNHVMILQLPPPAAAFWTGTIESGRRGWQCQTGLSRSIEKSLMDVLQHNIAKALFAQAILRDMR